MESQMNAVATLKDIQKDCLRMVVHHYSSKEIARKLGISRHTVDQRLRMATQHLQAPNRFEAARILANFEQLSGDENLYQPFVYQTSHLHTPSTLASYQGPDADRDSQFGTEQNMLQDALTPFKVSEIQATNALFSKMVSFGETPKARISSPMKIIWVIVISAISLLAFGASVAGLEVLSRI